MPNNFVKKLLNNIFSLKHEIFNNSKKNFAELEQEKVESKKPENFKEHFYFFKILNIKYKLKKCLNFWKKLQNSIKYYLLKWRW
ncbi:hypothetical protein SKUN_001580 [Spiroplasma kunkelii CR2-3x]|uniref:Uncharacterized protein n=1 Tax=Spiroplasma kunkelii CR2-3x TaxID=273035 RepID=A0A0K2JJ26_SPIKU|nr:hypothetical protein SKUN_001580 [Spiroplasma kunkelii CR2-3x]